LLAISYWRDSGAGHLGFTSEVSALLTLLVGALCAADVLGPFSRRAFVVASITVAEAVLLSQKSELRQFSTRVSREDVIATLKFLIVAVVVLPLLPNTSYGPWGVLNPFRIGMMVMLIAGLSFVGYVAMRWLGHGRGMLVTGAIGGLVSSTAITLASAARAKEAPPLARTAALAVTIASTIMFARVLATVFVVERGLLSGLHSLGVMGVTGLGATLWLAHRDRTHSANLNPEVVLKNPFELGSALKFGAFFVLILLVSRWASETFGNGGTYATAALAGLSDVDAITLSVANLVRAGELDARVGGRAIVLAASANTIVKGGLAISLCGGPFARRVVAVLAAVLAAGGASLLLESYLG
jgi:uncharacterized membrane protein (DUF4010 family)